MGAFSSKQDGEGPWNDRKEQRKMLRHVQESLREVAKQDGFFDCSKVRLQVRTDRDALTKFESDCIEMEVGDGFPGGWVEGAPLCSAPLLALQRSCVYLCDVLCENERLSGTSEDGGESRTPREGTKQAMLIAMLRAEGGATLAEMAEATGWAAHTVRGALSGALKKRLGLAVRSEKIDGRGRVYTLDA